MVFRWWDHHAAIMPTAAPCERTLSCPTRPLGNRSRSCVSVLSTTTHRRPLACPFHFTTSRLASPRRDPARRILLPGPLHTLPTRKVEPKEHRPTLLPTKRAKGRDATADEMLDDAEPRVTNSGNRHEGVRSVSKWRSMQEFDEEEQLSSDRQDAHRQKVRAGGYRTKQQLVLNRGNTVSRLYGRRIVTSRQSMCQCVRLMS